MNNSEYAFPFRDEADYGPGVINFGMTLRDYFAAKALAGLLVRNFPGQSFQKSAEAAYQHADAMLIARAQSPRRESDE